MYTFSHFIGSEVDPVILGNANGVGPQGHESCPFVFCFLLFFFFCPKSVGMKTIPCVEMSFLSYFLRCDGGEEKGVGEGNRKAIL